MAKYGVVGAGLVGSIFKGFEDYEVIHRDEWQPMRWDGLVNCCAIAGRAICDESPFEAVLEANVRLPMNMSAECLDAGVPFITFSTSGVYRASRTIDKVDEQSPIYPQNCYIASKMLMEATLPHDRCFIFRIPQVITPNDEFGQKVKGWKVVEDLSQSVIYPDAIVQAVNRVMMTKQVKPGIYNLASEVVHLPTFIRNQYGWEGEVVKPYSLGYTPPVILDTTKAKQARLI